MMLDEFLLQVRLRRLILISAGDVLQALRLHIKHMLTLIRDGDIRVCPSRDLHRQYWRHAGNGRYICEVCERIEIAV
jgi:hypothetical protein